VLDTWFSSALWPFATLGWPQDTPELKYFYPTDVLVTARDIIYLWVARMIFSSLEYLDEIPFSDVYIYATVMNEEGKRMSKSLGTGVDPLDLIEKVGADALRFSLMQQAGMNQDIRFSEKRVEDIRNFGNKIWNASRFVIMNLEGFTPLELCRDMMSRPNSNSDLRLEDRWILSRLQDTIAAVNDGFASYQMDDAARSLYHFIWDYFCDWYIELAKPRLRGTEDERRGAQSVLYHVLETTLRLLHPIMPFITEEIWQALPHEGESIMVAPFPEVEEKFKDQRSQLDMETVIEVVRGIRSLRVEAGVPPGKSIDVIAVCPGIRSLVEPKLPMIKGLARVGSLEFADSIPEQEMGKYVGVHETGLDLYIEAAGLIDVEKELARANAELESISKDLAHSEGKLANEQFVSKAPAEIIDKERRKVAELTERKQTLLDRKQALGG